MGNSTMKRVTLALCGVLLITTAASGCSGKGGPSGSRFATMNGEKTFPSDRATDWVSYATQISAVTVVSDSEVAMPPDVVDRGEGYQAREALFHVDQNLWSAAGEKKVVEFKLYVAGWIVHDGKRQAAASTDSPRFVPGERFIMPISRDSDGSVTTMGSEVPLTEPIEGIYDESDQVVKIFKNLPLAEVAKTLSETSPDPLAVKYMNLSPYDRARRVIDETQGH